MKKQILAALVCGLVVPLAMMLILHRLDAEAPDIETEPTETTIPVEPGLDGQTVLCILSRDGSNVQMGLDEYLTGVVLSEMPADFAAEALKAQAVVARTYTCKRTGAGSKHGTAAVCMDAACCQGYVAPEEFLAEGGTAEAVERVRRAVSDTDGQVLLYQGELIDATYFSCSGGWTEDAVAVWGQDVPYLQAVESPGEEDAPRYEEEVRFTPAEFAALTGCTGEGSPETWFGGVTYTDGGGVETMEICGEVYTGTGLRALLSLRSTAFSVSVEDDMIVIHTRGYGHRVGMSQYGAQAMAQAGSGYEEILRHYYQGAELGSIGGESQGFG